MLIKLLAYNFNISNNAHIFTSKDDSLFECVSTYKSVAKDYSNVEASIKFADDEKWSDTLGEKEEIEQARKIMQDSLKMATDKISLDEIKQAKDQELINQGELIEFVKNKRLQEMKSSREKSQKSSNSHNQKQS
ncbi:hypothetical protein [uncultured Gammaproteobacteria bacterium]|nr:hypothetical protein [uncultured Gammaproteobacteria bacterium]CAC9564987.1 hypothetical protein [uncultured Gammaproteobacteria bacterium]CAC9569844.1 hypothetical protein [uncultured Gammaproteobacteria bacterium]CAC9575169.1 hypothetical protein [uncultured Gammaproteobacteria bacterium]CAC9578739.1 hypothetical protein [uncultured Gammaproteobacteria bacterium]